MASRPRKSADLRRRVRLSQLELLAALNRAPTLSAADREVNLSQPAASRLLNTLAADLAIDLFERAGRTLRPTPAGRALLERAAGLMSELDRAQSELEAIGAGFTGTVAVGAGVGAGDVLVPQALTLLHADAPGIAVALEEGPMENLSGKLREGRIDLLVGRIDATLLTPQLTVDDLYNPPTAVVCGPRHPLARRGKIGFDEIVAHEWILPARGTPMRGGLDILFRRLRYQPERCLIESSSIQTNVALLNKRPLLWVVSGDIADYFVGLGLLKILPLPALKGPAPLVAAYRRDRALSVAAKRLLQAFHRASETIRAAAKPD
ncbi:MAG: LysR family transcriptional regulator [Pseudolabrys sp.]